MRKSKKGVSLIEILVVVTVFSILAILATRGVLLTLRGARKSDSIGEVRENVDFSFAVMERNLRNAESVTCVSETRVDYVDKNSVSASFSCEDLSNSGYIASSSARLTSDQVTVTECTFTCNQGGAGVQPSVMMSVVAQDANAEGVETAQVSVSTQIFLRTY